MTDSRLPDSWLLNPVLDKFSHEAWRFFTRALMFCNQQGTDGEIDPLYVRFIWPYGDPSEPVDELLASGWFERRGDLLLIPDWQAKGQSTADEVEAQRARKRKSSQSTRDKKKSAQSSSAAGDVSGDVSGDVGQDRLGQDRLGQDSYGEVSWPEVRQPGTPRNDEGRDVSHVS